MPLTTSHLMRAYARQPVSFVRGRGACLWDAQGVEYLDAIAGMPIGTGIGSCSMAAYTGERVIVEAEVNRRRAIHAAAAIVFELAGQLRQRHGFNNAHVAKAVVKHVQIFEFAG